MSYMDRRRYSNATLMYSNANAGNGQGSHGSKTASSLAYVQAITPEAATISCAAGNEYKFPHKQSLDNLAKVSAKVYRTDQDGTISIVSDGKTYSISKAH